MTASHRCPGAGGGRPRAGGGRPRVGGGPERADGGRPRPGGSRSPPGDRAVSVTINYTLNLAMATLLISGLLFAVGNTVEDRRQTAIRSELEVVGQRLAANLQSADRMARAGGPDSRVRIETPLPASVATTSYRVALDSSGGQDVVRLSTTDPAVEVEVAVRTRVPLSDTEEAGGTLVVVFDGTSLTVVRP